MRRKIIIGVLSLVVLVGVTTIIVINKKKLQDNQGQPQQSAEEILKERANQAMAFSKSPLGISFTAKNWVEFDKLYHPEKDFIELAQLIRGSFISNSFREFKKEDQEQVLTYVVKTFSDMKSQDFALAGLLITQFERLATPIKGSANYKAIEAWYSETAPALKRMAVLKLGIQDSNPSTKWVNAITQAILVNPLGINHSSWVQKISDIRSIEARKAVLSSVVKNFTKLEASAQSEALIVLANNSSFAQKQIKDTFFKFLASNDQKNFEAALKSVLPLKEEKVFSAQEITKIKDRLLSVSDELKTPYVEMKSKELLNRL